uniref:Transmembrane protein n=1 Tax=Trichobilharzia regenti TaxID=157069 RepID=A0AA85J348_TRIRE
MRIDGNVEQKMCEQMWKYLFLEFGSSLQCGHEKFASALSLSFATPGLTAVRRLWNILTWFLTLAVSAAAIILGYKMEKLSKKSSITVLSLTGGIAVLGVILLIALEVAKCE